MTDDFKILDSIRQNVLSIHYPYIKPFVRINKYLDLDYQWNNNEALIMLNKCLFKHYFGVEYEFPIDSCFLVPRLPIRLKYLCWIDRIILIQKEKGLVKKSYGEQVTGLDIGTGANLVLPLLAKSVKDWNFVATEINIDSIKQAKEILEKNPYYISSIEIRKIEKGILKGNINKKEEKFDFLCCNPPFYSSKKQKELIEKTNFVGSNTEIYYKNGEIGFMVDLIQESIEVIGNIGLYTCFIQRIDSVHKIQEKVKSLENKYDNLKVHFWMHEQPLGRISRYFLAWCYEITDLSINKKMILIENSQFVDNFQQESISNDYEIFDDERFESEDLCYDTTKKFKENKFYF